MATVPILIPRPRTMHKAALKSYAPAARFECIQAVTDGAKALGLSAKAIEPAEVKDDAAIIAGQAFPKDVAERRAELERQSCLAPAWVSETNNKDNFERNAQ
jgi:hypothetical protein